MPPSVLQGITPRRGGQRRKPTKPAYRLPRQTAEKSTTKQNIGLTKKGNRPAPTGEVKKVKDFGQDLARAIKFRKRKKKETKNTTAVT